MMKKNRRFSYYLGHLSEILACVFLGIKFYKLLHRRYKTPFGEVDIIAKKGNNLIFIEVKYRKKFAHKEHVSAKQVLRIKNAAQYFIHSNKKFVNYNISFDVVYISNFLNIEHIKSCW